MPLFSPRAFWTITMLIPALAIPASAAAQTPPGDATTESLRLTVSASGGYDSDITGVGADPAGTAGAPYGGGMVALRYQKRSEKIGISARGVADSRYYRADQPISAASYSGSAAVTATVTPRLNVTGSVNTGYSPRFVISALPVAGDLDFDIAPAPLDYGVSGQSMASYVAGANASLRVSRRSQLHASASRGTQKLLDENYVLSTNSYGGGYSHSVTKYASLRAGYSEYVTEYPAHGASQRRRFTRRTLDAGVDYSRPLSISRRTTLSFGSGSSAIDDGVETFYTITGNASLMHQIGRTWEANVAYVRGLGIVGGLGEPLFADAVNANLRGQVTNRVQAVATVGFADGNVGLGSRADDFRSFQASTRVEMIMKRERVGVFGNYFYHAYTFDASTPTVVAIPRHVNRHGVRFGVVVRFPLIEERNPRVTR